MENKLNIPELYSNSLRNITVIFGSVFSNLSVKKYNKDGTLSKQVKKVPLSYTEKQAYAQYWDQKTRLPNGNLEIARNFPRMSFEMTSLSMDPSRGVNTNLFRLNRKVTPEGESFTQRAPIAYKFGFNLTVWTNNMNESIQILEQILPIFSPEISIKINETSSMNIVNDVQITLLGINKDDNYQAGLDENRIISWSLDFEVSANIIQSVEKTTIIKTAIVQIVDETTSNFSKGITPDFLK